MQINGFHNNIAEFNKISGNTEIGDKQKIPEESFKDSLHKNLYSELGDPNIQSGRAWAKKERPLGKKNLLHVENAEKAFKIENIAVRNITYEQCDRININVLEGFTLKAKVEEPGENGKIYVEAKYDDGREEAYLIDNKKISSKIRNPIEQIAHEINKNNSISETEA